MLNRITITQGDTFALPVAYRDNVTRETLPLNGVNIEVNIRGKHNFSTVQCEVIDINYDNSTFTIHSKDTFTPDLYLLTTRFYTDEDDSQTSQKIELLIEPNIRTSCNG